MESILSKYGVRSDEEIIAEAKIATAKNLAQLRLKRIITEGWDEAPTPENAVAPPAPRFKLLTRAEFGALPQLEWLIRGVLPTRGIAAIYGPSGSGKSFLVLDALLAIAEGNIWFNYKVKEMAVVYVALEGTAGIKQRVDAWEKKHGGKIPNHFRLVVDQFSLNSHADVLALQTAICNAGLAGGVVAIDTLNASAPEADENRSEDMGRLIKNATLLQQYIGGVVVLVHHTGKDTTRGLRGHSSLLAALDAAIEVSRSAAGSRHWTMAKTKDFPDGTTNFFKLEVVPLGLDQDGEPRSSCVVVPAPPPPAGSSKKGPQGGNQLTALTIIEGLLRASPDFGQSMASAHVPCIKVADAIAGVTSGLVLSDPKRKRERAEAAVQGLIGRGLLACGADWLWAS